MRLIMRVPFIKMHGLGNDFVVLDAREQSLPEITANTAAALADRNTGIGCDQLQFARPLRRRPGEQDDLRVLELGNIAVLIERHIDQIAQGLANRGVAGQQHRDYIPGGRLLAGLQRQFAHDAGYGCSHRQAFQADGKRPRRGGGGIAGRTRLVEVLSRGTGLGRHDCRII